jgi:hypothetical protein
MIGKPFKKITKLSSKLEEKPSDQISDIKRIASREKSEGDRVKFRSTYERSPDVEKRNTKLPLMLKTELSSETTKYLLKSEEIFPKSESTPNIKKDIIFSLANNNDEKKLDLDNSDKLPRLFKQKTNTVEDEETIQKRKKKKVLKLKSKNPNGKSSSKNTQIVGIPIELKSAINPEKFAKYKGYIDFIFKVNLSNNQIVTIPNEKDFQPYKCYVGKGNNGLLVKNIIKNRWWWTLYETLPTELESLNFVWTQLRMNDYLELIKPYKRNKGGQDSLETSN